MSFRAYLGTILKVLTYILRLQSWEARLGKHALNFFQNHVGESALAMQFSVSEGSHASQSRCTGIQNWKFLFNDNQNPLDPSLHGSVAFPF